MLDIKTWLETTAMKVAEERFLKPPELPYIVFVDKKDIRGSDSKNCIADRDISIELYSERIDVTAESTIEMLLREKEIHYSKGRTWIPSEMFFETIYDFELIEKF